jgi:hypothetical protein
MSTLSPVQTSISDCALAGEKVEKAPIAMSDDAAASLNRYGILVSPVKPQRDEVSHGHA